MEGAQTIESLEKLLVRVLLPPDARTQYENGAVGHTTLQPLANTIQRLSERYVSRQGVTPLTSEEATAYALYYTPVNGAKVRHILTRCFGTITPQPRVLDYGCGPGTASLIASYLFDSPTITAVDAAPAMREIATRLLRARATETPFHWQVGTNFTGEFDLIVAANMLNELSPAKGRSLLTELGAALAPQGCLLTLEPALLETTRSHMALRDVMLERFPELTIVFPCTHREPCPMLRHEQTEWCHAPLPWHEPSLIRQIDALTGFNKHRPKYSAFVFTRGGGTPTGIRVLRGAEKSARGATALVCGPNLYGEVTLLKRHKTEENRLFQKVEVYDRIAVEPPVAAGFIDASAHLTLLERTSD